MVYYSTEKAKEAAKDMTNDELCLGMYNHINRDTINPDMSLEERASSHMTMIATHIEYIKRGLNDKHYFRKWKRKNGLRDQ